MLTQGRESNGRNVKALNTYIAITKHYPGYRILLTGYSLGGRMAIYVTAAVRNGVVPRRLMDRAMGFIILLLFLVRCTFILAQGDRLFNDTKARDLRWILYEAIVLMALTCWLPWPSAGRNFCRAEEITSVQSQLMRTIVFNPHFCSGLFAILANTNMRDDILARCLYLLPEYVKRLLSCADNKVHAVCNKYDFASNSLQREAERQMASGALQSDLAREVIVVDSDLTDPRRILP